MAETMQTAFRLPAELLARLDKYAKRLSELDGMTYTRTDVVRRLLTRALNEVEHDEGRRPWKRGT
jgi:predicted DNA-binding protein